ncbi:MAG: hypothetical protein HZA90_13205 [Verrucomicrobia bacterium]|nr:hypothetical protein [Verrucomicrobiota bacterium]
MTTEALAEALRGRRPFKVTAADGRTFDVPHPEFAALSRSGRLLYVMLENDRMEALDVALITGLQQESPLPV